MHVRGLGHCVNSIFLFRDITEERWLTRSWATWRNRWLPTCCACGLEGASASYKRPQLQYEEYNFDIL